jgi:hypothetical protein
MLKFCVIDCDMKVDLCLKAREYTTPFVTLTDKAIDRTYECVALDHMRAWRVVHLTFGYVCV